MNKLGISHHSSAKKLLLSATQEFNIIQPQFYFPGFDVISEEGYIYSPESILDSKYKIINIDYQIDRNINKVLNSCDYSSSGDSDTESLNFTENNAECEEKEPSCSEQATTTEVLEHQSQTEEHEGDHNVEKQEEEKREEHEEQGEEQGEELEEQKDDGEWTDCSSESEESNNTFGSESVISEYDLLANNTLDIPDEECSDTHISEMRDLAEQAKFFEQIRQIDKTDNTDNCFSLMATIQKTHNGNLRTYHQKIFCKKAPLIEPLKAIDPNIYPELLSTSTEGTLKNLLLPDPNSKQVFDKLNSIHNTSHVETLALYALSKLTEQGRAPAFPYYFGSIQGIMPIHYHNITDEIKDYSELDWFNELLDEGKIDVLYIDISDYVNSGREILRSEDMNLSIPDSELPTESEISNIRDKVSELSVEFETLMEDSDVTEFIATGKFADCAGNNTKDDFNRSQPSSAKLEFEDLDEIDIDTLKPDDILPEKKFDNKLFYLKLEKFPVSFSFMEKMNGSLDDAMNAPKPMEERELLSVLFQVAFGLAVANKEFRFVHNDLHAGNIMFQSTPQKYLYYLIHGNYYRVPTFNKIAKIIDFARATMFIKDKWIVSDAFEPDNDAGEQYAMPDANGKYGAATYDQNGNKLPRPNPSFDLSLLSTILVQYVSNNMPTANELNNMLNHWATDKHGINHVHSAVDFSLYTNIARDCHNAIPKEVLKHKLFQQFKVTRKQIPKKQYIYKY